MRRYYNPPELFGGAPQRRMRRWLMKPPDLTRAGMAPDLVRLATPERLRPQPPGNIPREDWDVLGPGLQSYLTDMHRGPSAAPSLTAAPAPPAAPDLTYEDYKAQPPSLRLAGVQPSEMSPYEIEEYANEMVAQRKAQKAQRMQDLYEQSRAEGMVLPGETIQVGEPRMYTPKERGRRVGATDILRLKSGKATPEQVAEIRRERWRKAPELFPEEEQFIPPDLKAEVGRFAKMLPPDLQVGRARHKYAMEHPEAPTLPRYETTETFKRPWGTVARKSITPPTQLEIEQARARIASEKARTAYYERPPTATPSSLMKMVREGILTLEDAKRLAAKEKEYPEGYLADLQNAVSAISRGADPYPIYRKIATAYPGQSTDLKRILLYTPATKQLEALQILFRGD